MKKETEKRDKIRLREHVISLRMGKRREGMTSAINGGEYTNKQRKRAIKNKINLHELSNGKI